MLKSVSLITALVLGLTTGLAHATPSAAKPKSAAEIVLAKGKVLLNRGEGFVEASAQTPLFVGDQLLVGSDSSAQLVYAAADCTMTVSAGSLVRITDVAPCKKGESLAMADQTIITPAFFGGTNDNNRLLALAPIVVVGGLVLFMARTYKEPAPASGP